MIERLEPRPLRIMEELAKYKFLSYSQILFELQIYKHRSNLSTGIASLLNRKRPFVRKIPHGIGDSAIVYLTKFGMEVLCELRPDDYTPETVHYVDRVLYSDTQNKKHRTTGISIQIALNKACKEAGLPILLCEREIDTIGNRRRDNNLTSKTAIEVRNGKNISPDIVFIIQTSAQKELYLLELENGDDHGKSFTKCINHAKALVDGAANRKYDHTHTGYRTVWVFEDESTMLGTMKRFQASEYFPKHSEYFLFATVENIFSDFWGCWVNAAGLKRNLYYIEIVEKKNTL